MKKMKSKQIKIEIERQPIDWLIEIIGWIGIVFLIFIPAYYYHLLPDIIPSHYDLNGIVNGTSNKSIIWVLPLIGLSTYIGLFILNRYPEIFNYPKEITEENAEQQYRLATRLIRVTNSVIIALFAYLTFSVIHRALGNQDGLVNYFVIAIISIIFSSIGTYMYFSMRKNKP